MVSSMSSFSPPSIRQRKLSKSRAFTARCSRKSPGRAVSSASCYSHTHRCTISTAMGIDNVFHPSTPSPPTATPHRSTLHRVIYPALRPPRRPFPTIPTHPFVLGTLFKRTLSAFPGGILGIISLFQALRSVPIAFAGFDQWSYPEDSAV